MSQKSDMLKKNINIVPQSCVTAFRRRFKYSLLFTCVGFLLVFFLLVFVAKWTLNGSFSVFGMSICVAAAFLYVLASIGWLRTLRKDSSVVLLFEKPLPSPVLPGCLSIDALDRLDSIARSLHVAPPSQFCGLEQKGITMPWHNAETAVRTWDALCKSVRDQNGIKKDSLLLNLTRMHEALLLAQSTGVRFCLWVALGGIEMTSHRSVTGHFQWEDVSKSKTNRDNS